MTIERYYPINKTQDASRTTEARATSIARRLTRRNIQEFGGRW
jgi:hypothetical protein